MLQSSILPKLLAKEDITIRHGNYHTAWFDVKNRVLGLPNWKDMGKEALEGLQGAAKYSPAEQIADFIWQPAFDAIGRYAEGRDETELNFPAVETVPDTNDIYYSDRTPQDKLDLMQDRIDYDTLFYGYLNNNPDANVVADRTLELTNTVYNR